MGRKAWLLLLASAVTAAAGQTLGQSAAAEGGNTASVASPGSVVAKIRGFRAMEAAIDPRTDLHHLRLRLERPGITLWRSAAWDEVEWVQIGHQKLSGPQLQQLVERLRAEHPRSTVPERQAEPNNTIVIRGRPEPIDGQQEPVQRRAPPERSASKQPQGLVRFLKLDATVANWDADPETDGLLVRIEPVGEDGAPVAVSGLLEVELVAFATGRAASQQPFTRIAYWAEAVWPEDFGPGGAVYRLPFQQVHPEFDRQYAAHASVLARLSVPAMGVFAATADTVRIRPFSPVRDKLQQLTGQRFFPQEHTTDGRR